MNNTLTNLPYRLTENAFRDYESFIAKATSSHPLPYIFPDDNLPRRSSTFVARLRDAMASLQRYRWTTIVDMEKFDKHYTEIKIVRHDHVNGRIIVGAWQKPKERFIPDVVDLPIDDSSVIIEVTTKDQKYMLAELASYRLLVASFRVRGLTPDDKISLEENFDVAITQNVDGTWTIK